MKSLWHKPGCKWVTSTGITEKTARDKDCPACEEEVAHSFRSSQKEELWQSQLNDMKKQIEKDPYEFLFGASHDRLRAILPKSFLASSNFPWWEDSKSINDNGAEALKTVGSDTQADMTQAGSKSIRSIDSAKGKNVTCATSPTFENTQARSPWYSTTSGPSSISEEPPNGLVFDPISMRMVRKVATPADLKALHNASNASSAIAHEDSTLLGDIQAERPVQSAEHHVDQGPLRTKKTFEQAWEKENAAKSQSRSAESRGAKSSNPDTGLSFSPHYTSGDANTTRSMLLKDKPLKHMNARALSQHEIELTKAFKRRHRDTQVVHSNESIDKEVENLKATMTALEGKISSEISKAPGGTEAGGVSVGLDDYERRAGHDLYNFTSGEDGLESKLANSEISGNPITAATIKMNQDLHPSTQTDLSGYEDYEKKAGPGLYTFTSGQDALESDLASCKISGNPVTAAIVNEIEQKLESTSDLNATGYEDYERKAGPGLYNFTMGQDSLETDLTSCKISGNPTSAACVKHYDDRTAQCEAVHPCSSDIQADIAAFSIPKRVDEGATTTTSPQSFPIAEHVKQSTSSVHPALYQVLAYDPSNQSIHAAVASSSFTPPTGDSVLSIPEALAKLQSPAKFLPHLSKHQDNGYEIVSASKHLLVLKQVRPDLATKASSESPASTPKPEVFTPTQPLIPDPDAVPSLKVKADAVDEVTIFLPQTGNFASPTGFVNHDTFHPEHVFSPSEPPTPSRKVRKEEPVFSGVSLRARPKTRSCRGSEPQPPFKTSEDSVVSASPRTARSHVVDENLSSTNSFDAIPNPRLNDYDSSSSSVRRRPRIRYTMLVAFWTAACCYATGAIVEHFRVRSDDGYTSSTNTLPPGLAAESRRWQNSPTKGPVAVEPSTSTNRLLASNVDREVGPTLLWTLGAVGWGALVAYFVIGGRR